MTADDVIEKLGGTGELATLLALDKSTVSKWRRHGIPPGQWSAVVKAARRKRLPAITFELLAELPTEARA